MWTEIIPLQNYMLIFKIIPILMKYFSNVTSARTTVRQVSLSTCVRESQFKQLLSTHNRGLKSPESESWNKKTNI